MTIHFCLSYKDLSFIPLSSYSFFSKGTDPYSSSVSPDVTFPFGTTTVSSIYVRKYLLLKKKLTIIYPFNIK